MSVIFFGRSHTRSGCPPPHVVFDRHSYRYATPLHELELLLRCKNVRRL